MSIIAEALKKAQERYAVNKKTGETPTAAIITRGWRRPVFPARLLVGASLFLLAGLLFYLLNQSFLKVEEKVIEKASFQTKPEEVFEETTQAEPLAEEETEAYSPVLPDLSKFTDVNKSVNLSGVMYTQEKPLAVINGSVYGEGEIVGGFKILEIGEDFVKLASDDRQFVVKMKR